MYEHGNMNIKQQNSSYGSFVKITTYTTVFLVILLLVMAATLLWLKMCIFGFHWKYTEIWRWQGAEQTLY